MATHFFQRKLLDQIHSHPSAGNILPEYTAKAVSTIAESLIQAVNHGLGNSMLVVGSPGSGKSMVMEQAFAKVRLSAKHNYTLVRLNGLVHTDDKLALMEIASSLSTPDSSSSNLQQVLVDTSADLSFHKALNLVLGALRSGDKYTQSVIVLLEEFDLFAHHHNQTLLYNLFDLSQSGFVPMMVVGVTSRLDVMGLLEKRVKSRFSHNQIVLFNHLSLEDYVTLFRDLLTLPGKDMFVTKWNTSVKSLSAHPDVVAVLEEQYSQTKDVRTLKKFLVVVVCSCLSQGLKTVSLKDLEFARSLFSVDSKETILKSLTVLEMMLVVATRRVKDVHPNSPINFEMVYREYKQFTQSSNSVPFYKKAVAMKTFEHLQSLEVIAPVDFEGGGSKLLKEYTHVILTVTDEHIEQALLAHKTCPAEVVHWGTGPGVAA